MEQPNTSAQTTQENVRPAQQSLPPAAPARGQTALIAAALIVILLAAGVYYFWSDVASVLEPSPVENTVRQQAQPATAPDEMSGLEADLNAIDVGSDAELTELESQL